LPREGGALLIVGLTLAKGGDWLAFAFRASEAAIRHGLAAGFVGAYLTVLGFSLTDAAFTPSLVKHLTWVVGVVVTFYFGSTTVSEFIASKRTPTKRPTTTTGTTSDTDSS
jgi:hypothetical protein